MDVADFSGEARTPPLRMGRHYRSVEFQQLDLEAGLGLVAVMAEVAGGGVALDVLLQEGAEVVAAEVPVGRGEGDRVVAGGVVLAVLQRGEEAGGDCPLLHASEAVDVSRDAQARSGVDLNPMMDRSLQQEFPSSVT